jgi:3-deoxy-7-phosphoheptulonate synthase
MAAPQVLTLADGSQQEAALAALRTQGLAATVLSPTRLWVTQAPQHAAALPGVIAVNDAPPWPLASTLTTRAPVKLGDLIVGGRDLVIIAGPCAVESAEQLERVGSAVFARGAHALRGGAFKPRTSPYSFQGLEGEGLALLQAFKQKHKRPVVTEVMDTRDVEAVAAVSDALQVGARNMQNTALLQEVGRSKRPVLLKRGFGATVNELLHAAEYILAAGNDDVILCERGIRTFETCTRFTLDVGGLAWLKQTSRLPVLVDPSHAAGVESLVVPLALAGIAAGADGLLIEVHDDAAHALSDGDQALSPDAFSSLLDQLRPLAAALSRSLSAPLSARG